MTKLANLIACIPVDRSKLPDIPELAAVVVTDLYTLRQCEIEDCGDVWVGPRQLAAYNQDPANSSILCYLHALAIHLHISGSFDPDTDLANLGGGYPVEGRARI